MGWNAWNAYECKITEDIFKLNVDKMVELGLTKAGYVYANLDDCWSLKNGVRTEDGHIQWDPIKFPLGMKSLADYVKSKGMKFGIYSSAGRLTCQEYTGSIDHEDSDAADFASWGVEYFKYDNCYAPDAPAPDRFNKMGQALIKATEHTENKIYYSMCNWGQENVWQWGGQFGNSWRTTADISPTWNSLRKNFLINQQHPEVAKSGSWNDPDMFQIGNVGMNLIEYKSQFALWAFAKAPMILGTDLTKITPEVLEIVKNPNLIAISQDSHTVQCICIMNCKQDLEVYWTYNLDNGPYHALLLINWSDTNTHSAQLDFYLLDISPSANYDCDLTDLWTGELIGTFARYYYVPDIDMHSNVALKVVCHPPKVMEAFLNE